MRLRLLLLSPALSLAFAAPAAALTGPGEVMVSALAGPPKASFLAKIRAGEIGGVILVGRWTPRTMRGTTEALHFAGCSVGRPLLTLVDQEGGWARRLTWAAPQHTAGELGRLGSSHTRDEARATAKALREAGIDIDLAPVADTLGPGGFLGGRSFGTDPAGVGALAATFIRALQAGRIAATAKHFPGLGASRANTDQHRVTLRTVRLGPFRDAIAAAVRLVMVSSAIYPRLDASRRPAVFSREIIGGLLRGALGFRGTVVSDALDAPAPAATPHAAARALDAGVDLLLYTSGSTAHAAYVQLTEDLLADPSLQTALTRARANVGALKRWLGRSC